MVDMVCSGRLGMVTICLESEDSGTISRPDQSLEKSLASTAPSTCPENVVRIYCFGAAVKEIWAVIYVHSFKMVKKDCLPWIDAAGFTVIRF
jgi:hypothetical protein